MRGGKPIAHLSLTPIHTCWTTRRCNCSAIELMAPISRTGSSNHRSPWRSRGPMLEVQTGFGNQGDIEIQALTQLALAVRRWLSNGEVGANQNRVSSSTAVLLLPGWVGLVQLPASGSCPLEPRSEAGRDSM